MLTRIITSLTTAILLAIASTGCSCVDSVKVEVGLQAVGPSGTIEYKFKDCLSKAEKRQVERAKEVLLSLLERATDGVITWEEYAAGFDRIEAAINVLQASDKTRLTDENFIFAQDKMGSTQVEQRTRDEALRILTAAIDATLAATR